MRIQRGNFLASFLPAPPDHVTPCHYRDSCPEGYCLKVADYPQGPSLRVSLPAGLQSRFQQDPLPSHAPLVLMFRYPADSLISETTYAVGSCRASTEDPGPPVTISFRRPVRSPKVDSCSGENLP